MDEKYMGLGPVVKIMQGFQWWIEWKEKVTNPCNKNYMLNEKTIHLERMLGGLKPLAKEKTK